MRYRLPPEPMSQAAVWSRRLALFAALAALLSVALSRLHRLDAAASLTALGSSLAVSLVALLLFFAACVTIWQEGRRGTGAAVSALLVIALTLAWPAYLAFEAVRLPVLSDISTDVAEPPHFSLSSAADKARRSFRPPGVSEKDRETQRAAYPGVGPIIADLDADEAFALVLKTAAAQGWKVIDQRPPGGRAGEGHADFIAQTLIMGFSDDIAVRLRPLAGQTRIDVRAASRHGRHDFGANAARITQFAEELQSQLDE